MHMLCGVSPRLPRTILLLLLLHGSPAAALFVGPRVPGAPLRVAPPAFAPLTLLRSTPAAAAAALVAGTASSASAAAESGAIANQLDDRLVVGFVLVRAPAHTFTAARSFYALAPTVSPSPFRAFLSKSLRRRRPQVLLVATAALQFSLGDVAADEANLPSSSARINDLRQKRSNFLRGPPQ